MLLRALGKMAFLGGRAAVKGTANIARAGIGLGYGAGIGALGLAAGAGYLGYRAVKGYGPILNSSYRMNLGIQSRLAGATLAGGAMTGLYTRNPMYRADFSPGGNLETKSPAMLNATGDLVLSMNRSARNVPSPTLYGYMTKTSVPGAGR